MSAETAPDVESDAAVLARLRGARKVASGSRTLGYEVLAVDQARQRVEVGFEASLETMANPMGTIQGGYLCAMLDEAMTIACVVASRLTHAAPTAEMKVSFLRPARAGALRGVGQVVKWGKTLAFVEGELFDADGRLVAKASATAVPTPMSQARRA